MSITQDAQIGLAEESTYGTAVTPDHFYEFTAESFDRNPTYQVSPAMRPGKRTGRSVRRNLMREAAGGAFTIEAPSRGLGLILEAALGAKTVTSLAGDATVYQQVHTLLTDDYGKSYTIQKGVPLLAGAVEPMTFLGSMCESLTIDFPNSDVVSISSEWQAKEVETSTALASATYPEFDTFTFVHGAITLGGTVTMPTTTALATGGTAVANIASGQVRVVNALDQGGWNLGGAGKRRRKSAVGRAVVSGNLVAEFDATTLLDAYLAGTGLSAVLTFTHSSTIGTSSNAVLQVVVPDIYLGGELPKANGGDVVQQTIPFEALDDDTNEPVYVVYRSLDSTV